MAPKRNGFVVFLVIIAALLMLGAVAVSQAEDCPDQGGKGKDRGVFDPPDTDDKNNGCDDEDTKTRENNGQGNDADCEDDSNGKAVGLNQKRCPQQVVSLSIVKSGVILGDGERIGFPDPGETIRYTLSVANTGNAPATNVVVLDDVNEDLTAAQGCTSADQPVELNATSAPQGWTTSGSAGDVARAETAELSPGETASILVDVTIPAEGTFHDCDRGSIDSDQTSQQFSNTVSF